MEENAGNAENTATNPPVSETNANAGISEPTPAEPLAPAEPAPADTPEAQPKRRGRPAGAKDKQPRKQKPRIVEIDIAHEASQASEPSAPSAPAPQPQPLSQPPVHEPEPAQPSEPMTPRRMYRETATHLAQLKTLINSQKRQALGEMYTRKLMTLAQ